MNYDIFLADMPACYRGLADAMDAYEDEKRNGFDGTLNEFLDMERHRLARDSGINDFERGAKDLWRLGEWAELRTRCQHWLDRAS